MIAIKRFINKSTPNAKYFGQSQYLLATKTEHLQKVPLPQRTEYLYEKYKDSILYSSFIENNKIKLGYKRNQILKNILKKQENDRKNVNTNSRPLSLAAQLLDNKDEDSIVNTMPQNMQKDSKYILEEKELKFLSKVYQELADEENNKVPTNWFTDYETFNEETMSNDGNIFGTPGAKTIFI